MGTLIAQKEAYECAVKNEWDKMVAFYEEGLNIMAPVTVARNSALHVAVESKNAQPLTKLLEIIEEKFPLDIESATGINYPVFTVNVYGNTVLHHAAIVGNYEAVKLLAERFPKLAETTNKMAETPLFRAASFGHTKVVGYLANEVPNQRDADGKLSNVHRQRSNGTSILYVAVQGQHFETALFLLNMDESLGILSDKDGTTALHLLAKMPSAFESGYKMAVLTELLYSCLPVEEYIPLSSVDIGRDMWQRFSFYLHNNAGVKMIHLSICKFLFDGWPIMKKIWDDKKKHKFALELANKLIEKDISWENLIEADFSTTSGFVIRLLYDSQEQSQMGQNNSVYELKIEKGSEGPADIDKKPSKEFEKTKEGKQIEEKKDMKTEEMDKKYTPIPLFIATENGIIEIVKKTLKFYPQAFEHVDVNGRNILHLAISYRRKKIFEYLWKDKRKQIDRLTLGIDNDGYTLLHHAADTEHYFGGSNPGPALQLQEELQWFEKVQELVPSHYPLHRAKKKAPHDDSKCQEGQQKGINRYTALELFKESHNHQLKEAQQWVKDTSQSCSTVAVLVATVVFAAAYTVPGGSNAEGVPVLSKSPYFLFFTIMDVISLACSLTSVVMFLSILTSPFELQEFCRSLPRKLTFGFTLLFLSVVTTMLTFGATILLTIHLEQKLTTSLLSIASFFPVLVFALMQLRLYVAFMGSIKELGNDIAKILPTCSLPFLCCKDKLD